MSSAGQSIGTQLQQVDYQQVQQVAPKILGVFKELEPNEKILYQSVSFTDVIFVKEAVIRGVLLGNRSRKEIPISMSKSLFYLTDQRIVFLKLFEMLATEVGEKENLLAGAAGTFYEMPLQAVTSVDMRPVQINETDAEKFKQQLGVSDDTLRRPALEIIYDEKQATGRAKDYMESMLNRGLLSRLFGKMESTFDKVFILGEQSVSIQPVLSQRVKRNVQTQERATCQMSTPPPFSGSNAFCRSCGASLPYQGARFCTKCGSTQ